MNTSNRHVIFLGAATIYGLLERNLSGWTLHYPIDQTGHPENDMDLFQAAIDVIRQDPVVIVLDDWYIDRQMSVKDLAAILIAANDHHAKVILMEDPDRSSRKILETNYGIRPICYDLTKFDDVKTLVFTVNEAFGGSHRSNSEMR